MSISTRPGIHSNKLRIKTSRSAKKKLARRQRFMEKLEDRTLLSYTFSYDSVTKVATATGNASTDSLVLEAVNGFVEYSVNGSSFASLWGGNPVPTSPNLTINVSLSTNDGSSLTVGTPAGPASDFLGLVSVTTPANSSDTATIDDTTGSKNDGSGNPYTINTGASPGVVSGNGFTYNESGTTFGGGVTLKGSDEDGDVFNVVSTVGSAEPFTLIGGNTGSGTVNVASSLDMLSSVGPLAIYTTGSAATVNLDDTSDTTHGTATFDEFSGNSNAPFEVTGLSGNPIEFGSGVTDVTLNGGTDGGSGVTYDIYATPSGTTTTVNGDANKNFFNLSNSGLVGGLGNLQGPVVVNGGSSNTDEITLEDSNNNASETYTVTDDTVTSTGNFGGLTYGNSFSNLTLNAGNDGNTNAININDTSDDVTTTDINGQNSADTIDVNDTADTGTLNVSVGTTVGSTVNVVADSTAVNITLAALGIDNVNIGSTGGAGVMTNIQGAIGIIDGPGFYNLNFDDSDDMTGLTWTLQNDDIGNTASVEVGGSATTSYRPGDIESLTINGGSGGNTFNVDNTTGKTNLDSALVTTTLNTGNGDDSVNVYGSGGGILAIDGEAGLDTVTLGGVTSVGMQDLNGTINLSNPFGFDIVILDDSQDLAGQSVTLADNGTTGTITGMSPATITYPDTDVSALTLDASLAGDNTFTVNGILEDLISVPTLTTIDTGDSSGNTVDVNSTTAGGELEIEDPPGPTNNTVNFDANGEVPTITAGMAADEVLLSIPTQGLVDSIGYHTITVSNIAPVVITPGSAQSISATEGNTLTAVVVGSFTFPIPKIGAAPIGVPASDFTATVDWGDPSPDDTAGTIVQDGSDPSLYDIEGTHAFSTDGMYTVANAVNFPANSYSSTLNGVAVTVDVPDTGSTPGTSATATVVHATLPVTVDAITGTEGLQHAAAPIATFVDNGGPHAVGGYSAHITITNSENATIISVAAASIVQVGSSNEYTVHAPAFTLPEEGTYTVSVAVTEDDSVDSSPYVSTGTGTAVISDAALTAGSEVNLTPNTGAAITNTKVGSFTDANPTAPVGDFTASINWGDGTAATAGTITQPDGVGTAFDVLGTHAYAVAGDYTITIHVTDAGGSTVTLTGSADVTDLPVTGAVDSFHAIENLSTGTIVLANFTDPNPLATVSDVTATLPIGGWGDGTPASVTPLTVVAIGGTSTTTLFEVTGSHTYTSHGIFTVNITVTTSGGAVTDLTAGTATVPNPNTILTYSKQPANVVAGATMKPVVIDLDSLSHKLMNTDNDQITIAIASGPTDELFGSTTVSAVNGVATFSNLSIQDTGTYTLIAKDGGVTVTSKSFTVTSAPVDFLEVAAPSSVTAGTTDPGINVYLIDQFDNFVTGNVPVTLTLYSGPAGGGISGKLTATAKDGIATFNGLSFDVAGTYRVMATCHGVTATSNSFTITPAAAATMTILTKPTTVSPGSPISSPIVVQIADKFGNLLTNNSNDVSLSLLTGPPAAVLGGTLTVALSGGVADFNHVDLTTPGNYTLLISFGGLAQEVTLTVT